MSSTYTRIVYQVVFSTKYRQPVLRGEKKREALFRYLGAIIKSKGCFMYQAGGVEDHVHLVFGLHPGISLAKLVKEVKLAGSRFIRQQHLFPGFTAWQVGYGAFTYTPDALPNLIRYVKNQVAHHSKESSATEYRRLLKKNGTPFNEGDPR